MLLVIPCLFIVGIECVLRIFQCGGDIDLVLATRIRGRDFFTINRNIGRRYFTQPGIAIPEPPDVLFPAVKSPHTKRIFCLGESTMEGFPYEYNATAPSLLKDRLASLLRLDTIEVINVGLSAVGSTVVRDMIGDLTSFAPDLFVIYVGHNEFYGAFGPGSSAAVGTPPWLTRLHLSLCRFRTYVLLRNGVSAVQRLLGGPSGTGATLMENMAGSQDIVLGSDLYMRGLSQYRANLEAIIGIARSSGVPILFSALVSNLKDQPPFVSLFPPGTPDSMKSAWDRTRLDAERLAAEDRHQDALLQIHSMQSIASTHAAWHFTLGRILESAGRFPEARDAFVRAKDLDALRFRATEEFQQALLDVCVHSGVTVARVDSAFAAASPHGIAGNGLFLEHVHPNVDGYVLMARVWAETIAGAGLLSPCGPYGTPLSDSMYVRSAGITSFDRAIAHVKIHQLIRHWPFHPDAGGMVFIPQDTVESIVYSSITRGVAWTQARYRVAALFAQQKQFDRARQECLAISKALPYSSQPLMQLAEYYAAEGNYLEAEHALRHSLAVEENPYGHMKLGVLFLLEQHAAQAADEFEYGFAADLVQHGILSTEERASGRSYLATAYARTGKFAKAKENARAALALNPGDRDAAELLRRLP